MVYYPLDMLQHNINNAQRKCSEFGYIKDSSAST